MTEHLTPPSWDQAAGSLIAAAVDQFAADQELVPLLLAYAGEQPLGSVVLRPFPPGGAPQALLEVLALLLPVGADRLVLGLPGRAWPSDEPVPTAEDGVDLRLPVMVVLQVDGRRCPSRVRATLCGLHRDDDGEVWGEVHTDEPAVDDPLATMLRTLLDAREAFDGDRAVDLRVPAQLGRVLLLGHQVALSPWAARWIERCTVAERG